MGPATLICSVVYFVELILNERVNWSWLAMENHGDETAPHVLMPVTASLISRSKGNRSKMITDKEPCQQMSHINDTPWEKDHKNKF